MKKRTICKKISSPLLFLAPLFLFFVLASCGGDYVPKPKGYYRIDLPEKKYRLFDSTYPFTFEYPVYAEIIPDTIKNAEPYWLNLGFTQFRGQVNLSYKVVKNNLSKYTEDAYNLVMKHIAKADNIEQEKINVKDHNVYGIIYDISGTGAASSYQFFVTDSTEHFIRGALYFNVVPNNDSLAPVITFLKTDIKHMIETLEWKKI